jgi:hypothetical protein
VVGSQGYVDATMAVTATDPAWTQATVDVPDAFVSVACPSPTLCLAGDAGGNIASSTSPAAGATAWTIRHISPTSPNVQALMYVTCAQPTLCFTITGLPSASQPPELLRSTDPASGTWRRDDTLGHIIGAVSCPTIALCFALGRDGTILSTGNPTAVSATWTVRAHVPASQYADELSCPTASFCVVSDGEQAFVTTNPTGGDAAWTKVSPLSAYGLTCPGPTLCIGIAGAKDLTFTTTPASARSN